MKIRNSLALSMAGLLAMLGSIMPAQADLIVDGGFRPVTNGFKFQNHGNTIPGPADPEGNPTQVPVTNLTTAEMIRFLATRCAPVELVIVAC